MKSMPMLLQAEQLGGGLLDSQSIPWKRSRSHSQHCGRRTVGQTVAGSTKKKEKRVTGPYILTLETISHSV